jgi:DHA1 family bicyclomycin/chloramphenicol resistance-like MFS transporter
MSVPPSPATSPEPALASAPRVSVSRFLIPVLALLPAFVQMAEAFAVDSGRIQGTLTAFFIGMASGQLFYGPLIDRYGRRKPLLAGIALYLVATLGCLLIDHIDWFTGFRLLQAVGGCAGMIVARAVVQDVFDPLETARTMSLLMMVMALAPAAAPVVGGWVLTWGNWHTIFAVMLGYGVLALALAWFALPETLQAHQRQPISASGIVRTYAGLLRNPAFRTPALVGALSMASLFSYITGSPVVLMDLYGLGEQQYGLVFGANALGIMAASQINRMCLRRWPVPAVLTAGLLLSLVAGALVLAAAALVPGVLVLLVVPLWFSIASVGLVGANSAALAMRASGSRAGSASAMLGALQFVIAAVFSGVVAFTQNGTAYPMAMAMVVAASAATVLWWVSSRRAKAST